VVGAELAGIITSNGFLGTKYYLKLFILGRTGLRSQVKPSYQSDLYLDTVSERRSDEDLQQNLPQHYILGYSID